MPPSTQEEIALQHAEAIRLVEDGMPCASRQFLGEIPISDKKQPTCLLFDQDNKDKDDEEEKKENGNNNENDDDALIISKQLKNPICFTTHGSDIDVTKLQQMIQKGYNGSYKLHNNKNDKDDQNDDDDDIDMEEGNDDTTNNSIINYWDPKIAAIHNVSITRPSHDGWGIGKIVLLFCDDFMTKVYELPWWKEFRPSLQPILETLGLNNENDDDNDGSGILTGDKSRQPKRYLVRALLASLPPGVTIPIHHDTGEWVKYTHRVHVPVLVNDPNKILFRCGPSVDKMQRIDCIPGHVFEINNQAKHAVSNCEIASSNYSRVHLILDYVVVDIDNNETKDDNNSNNESMMASLSSPPPRIVLDPGEVLVQTRRSVDRMKDIIDNNNKNNRPIPSYIILGAQKAGTTSLYEYINQHPWVVKACRRETHCFDWRWDTTLTTSQQQLEHTHKFFYTDHLKQHPSCITGDSTPSYLLDSYRVIPRIRSLFDLEELKKQKYFVMVRDPVKRALSHYAMVTSPVGTPAQLKTRGYEWRKLNFKQVIEDELIKMDNCGLIPYWNITTGMCDMSTFKDFVGSADEDKAFELYLDTYVPLNTGSYGILTRGMYALQIRQWFKSFDKNQFCIIKLESMKHNTDKTMKKVWNHLDLPYHPVEDDEAKNTREYQKMDPTTQRYLENFFEPHNRLLSKLLDDNDEVWDDPWPYHKK